MAKIVASPVTKSSSNITMERVMVTPELASEWVSLNQDNRPLQRNWIKFLQYTMERGEWRENGDSICFDENGLLFDGQHRLYAIINSGKTVPMIVLRGIRRETFHTKDQGKKRGMADVLAMENYKNTVTLAATLRNIKMIESGYAGNVQFTTSQLEDVKSRYASVVPVVDMFAASRARKFCDSSLPAVLTIGAQKYPLEYAELFIKQVATGEGLSQGDPALLFRNRMLESSMAGAASLRAVAKCALAIKAWNAFVDGKKLGVLRYNKDEQFPLVK